MKIDSYLLLGLVIFGIIACNRGNDDAKPPVVEPPKTSTPATISISTEKNISNLQVGEMFPIKFNIVDSDTLDATYVIRPETENAVFHQKLGVDFELKEEVMKSNTPSDSLVLTSVKKINLTPKQLQGKFFIHILRPGSFQHKYILEKYVKGVKKEETAVDFLFSAVKITAWTYHEEVRPPGTWNRSVHRRYWKFVIDDGKEKFDNYLTTDKRKTHTYTALYAGRTYHEGDGSISADVEKEYRASEDRKKTAPDIPSMVIENITIQQKQPDGMLNNITYKNIPVEIR